MTGPSDKPDPQYQPPPAQQQPSYPPPPGYPSPPPQPYAGYAAPVTPKNGLGVTSLVLAIVGLLACVFVVTGWVGVIFGLVAVILGFIGRGRVKRGQANNGGVAMAGIILGFLAILAGIAVTVILVIGFNTIGGDELVGCLDKAGSDAQKQQECADQFQRNIEDRFSITITPTP